MQYWPSEGTEEHGFVSVTLQDEKRMGDYVIRNFSLTNERVLRSSSVYRMGSSCSFLTFRIASVSCRTPGRLPNSII